MIYKVQPKEQSVNVRSNKSCGKFPFIAALLLFQRQFRRKAGAEELQSPAQGPDAEVLRPLPGELLGPLCHMSGVC